MATSATLFGIVKFAGAGYLLYLGLRLWRDKSAFRIAPSASLQSRSNRRFFTTALLIFLTNPKATLLIGALFPQFIPAGSYNLTDITIMSLTYAGLCYLNHVILAAFGGRLKKHLQSDNTLNWVRRTVGAAFIGCAATLATVNR